MCFLRERMPVSAWCVPIVRVPSVSSSSPCKVTNRQPRARAARVRADGTVAIGDSAGSIHKIGAQVQGLDACNGWTFWHYEAEGVRKPIDVLRDRARRQLGLSASEPASV